MANYSEILTLFYPDLEWKVDGDETVYGNITRTGGTPDPLPDQPTLDAWDPYVPTVSLDDEHELARNETGSTITKGTPVYASGVDGTAGQMLVAPCDADDPATFPCIGIAVVDILNNETGAIQVEKKLKDLDTSSFSKNDYLYVASGGGFTATAPTGMTAGSPSVGRTSQKVARVKKDDATKGEIVVDLHETSQYETGSASGAALQIVHKNITTSLSTTAEIDPATTPTSTDGTALDSLDITMNGANTVRVQAVIPVDIANDERMVQAMVHRGTTVLAVASTSASKGGVTHQIVLDFFDSPGTGTHTYSVRVGCTSTTLYVNQTKDDATPWGGTVYKNNCNIVLTELA